MINDDDDRMVDIVFDKDLAWFIYLISAARLTHLKEQVDGERELSKHDEEVVSAIDLKVALNLRDMTEINGDGDLIKVNVPMRVVKSINSTISFAIDSALGDVDQKDRLSVPMWLAKPAMTFLLGSFGVSSLDDLLEKINAERNDQNG